MCCILFGMLLVGNELLDHRRIGKRAVRKHTSLACRLQDGGRAGRGRGAEREEVGDGVEKGAKGDGGAGEGGGCGYAPDVAIYMYHLMSPRSSREVRPAAILRRIRRMILPAEGYDFGIRGWDEEHGI